MVLIFFFLLFFHVNDEFIDRFVLDQIFAIGCGSGGGILSYIEWSLEKNAGQGRYLEQNDSIEEVLDVGGGGGGGSCQRIFSYLGNYT